MHPHLRSFALAILSSWGTLSLDIYKDYSLSHFLQVCTEMVHSLGNHLHYLKFHHANNPYVFSLLNFLTVEFIISDHHLAITTMQLRFIFIYFIYSLFLFIWL